MNEHARLNQILPAAHLQMILFGGKGGVGKTTCAMAAALEQAHAHPHGSVLIVSTDPAHSLTDCHLGVQLPKNLSCIEFDAQSHLDTFKADHHDILQEIAKRGTFLDDEDVNQFLNLSLPGMDELMVFLEIAQWVTDQAYDQIIVDTAPTGHTLRLLEMPALSRSWVEALDTLLGKHRYMKKVFSGRYEPDEIDDFILTLSHKITLLDTLLKDQDQCLFVPVMIAEPLSLAETGRLVEALKHHRIPTGPMIVNRIVPTDGCNICKASHAEQIALLNQWARSFARHPVWTIPWYDASMNPTRFLTRFFAGAMKLKPEIWPADRSNMTPQEYQVMSAMDLPDMDKKLLFFAGKGGVGKTSLACATSVHLAKTFPHRQVVIISTDPAHSLSDCFQTPIADKPIVILSNLLAMQLDGKKEFEALKELYQQEIKAFLSRIASNLDLTFDREVMERVMDLSPTGVDEIMAINSALDLMGKNPRDLYILDTAPTGHLIRLLEMPVIMDQWIKVFFNLFLKYKHIFHAGQLSHKLVTLSKQLKQFVKTLHDPDKTGIYLVSILTGMALEETKDLYMACHELNIQLSGLFLNLATPAIECDFCNARIDQQTRLQKQYDHYFLTLHKTRVFAGKRPEGLEQLEKLGQALYHADA